MRSKIMNQIKFFFLVYASKRKKISNKLSICANICAYFVKHSIKFDLVSYLHIHVLYISYSDLSIK